MIDTNALFVISSTGHQIIDRICQSDSCFCISVFLYLHYTHNRHPPKCWDWFVYHLLKLLLVEHHWSALNKGVSPFHVGSELSSASNSFFFNIQLTIGDKMNKCVSRSCTTISELSAAKLPGFLSSCCVLFSC